jgi:hypothetical protein
MSIRTRAVFRTPTYYETHLAENSLTASGVGNNTENMDSELSIVKGFCPCLSCRNLCVNTLPYSSTIMRLTEAKAEAEAGG